MKMDRTDAEEAPFATLTVAAECYRLADLVVDAGGGRVRRGEVEIALPRLSWELLLALVRAAPAILSVDTLMDRVWPGLVVGPETVSQRVKLLREALGDDAQHPRYIAGVRGRGYRLACPVEPLGERRHTAAPVIRLADRRPLRLGLLLIVLVVLWWATPRLDPPATGPPEMALTGTLAVLPFTVRAAEGEGPRFFADGIHDDLLTRLTAIPRLRVISRSSVMPYRDSDKNLRQIGAELGVDTILEGSVQQVGDQIRINAQLIGVRSDAHLWAQTFDRQLTVSNLLAIQGEIAEAITRSLRLAADPQAAATIGRGGTDHLEAYSHLLAGHEAMMNFLGPGTHADMLAVAEDHFRRAIGLDPGFARAHAGLAQAIVQREWATQAHSLSPQRLAEARAAADRALELAPGLPDAHLALALYHYYGFRDYPRALETLAEAERRLPGSAHLPVVKGWILLRQGRSEEALVSLRRAVELDPRNLVAHANLGRVLWSLHRFDEVETVIDRMLELEPGRPATLGARATLALLRDGDPLPLRALHDRHPDLDSPLTLDRWRTALMAGDFEAARREAAGLGPEHWPHAPAGLYRGLTDLLSGQADSARSELRDAEAELRQRIVAEPDNPMLHAWSGLALAGLGVREAALAAARRAVGLLPLERDAVIGYDLLDNLAAVAAMAGDVDAAVATIDRLLSAPGSLTAHVYRLDPRFAGIREDPRFQALISKHLP